MFCKFMDSLSISNSVNTIIEDDELRNEIRKKAHKYGLSLSWARVGKQYVECFLNLTRRPQPEDLTPYRTPISVIQSAE
jgi:hypothetical protein